jgi:uncharacterized protein (DUF736 family)
MSQYQERPNSGALFVNNKKQSDKAPDFSGTLTVGDDVAKLIKDSAGPVQVRIAGWKKVSSNGNSWLSLSVSPVSAEKKPFKTSNRRNENDDAPWE